MKNQKGFTVVHLIFLVLLAGLAFTGYSYYQKSAELQANQKSYDELKSLKSKYDDKKSIAERAPRIALASLISDLNNFKSEVASIQVSQCMQLAKDDLVKHIDSTNQAMTEFMGNNDKSQEFTDLLLAAQTAEKDFNNDLEKCKR